MNQDTEEASDYTKYRGKCKEMSEAAVAADPSLTLVRGFYHCPFWGEQQHWWTQRADGSVFDPTKDQFPSKGIGKYEPVPEGGLELPCEECGKQIKEKDFIVMGNYVVCSNRCALSLVGL
jgi:hypothetical protein